MYFMYYIYVYRAVRLEILLPGHNQFPTYTLHPGLERRLQWSIKNVHTDIRDMETVARQKWVRSYVD